MVPRSRLVEIRTSLPADQTAPTPIVQPVQWRKVGLQAQKSASESRKAVHRLQKSWTDGSKDISKEQTNTKIAASLGFRFYIDSKGVGPVNIAGPRHRKVVGPWLHRPHRFLRLCKMTPATSASELAEQFKKAWARIKPDVLENLMAGMSQCVHGCVAMKDSHSGK